MKNEANRQAGEDFLKAKAAEAGVQSTASGLVYQIVRPGSDKRPSAADEVLVHYEGTLIDGTVFDSSYQRKEPIDFPLRAVIPGWTEGVQLIGEGGEITLYIPYQLAYGERGAGRDIPPYSALVFRVELLEIL